MAEKAYLAVDLGASGGRVLAGSLDGRRLALKEVRRFSNGPVALAGHLYWDLPRLWADVCDGLRAAAEVLGRSRRIVSVGVDAWGVDYGLLGANDELLGLPIHYRDGRTRGLVEYACGLVPRDEIFAETGLQFLEINTLYQLLAAQRAGSPVFSAARSLLMIPDLFHWLLTGEKANEITNASTTQLFNPATRDWSRTLIERFALPAEIFGPLVQPGAVLGPLRKSVAADVGLADASVVLPGTHDTASAVAAVPAASTSDKNGGPDWCYISSGTWSLVGLESPRPVVTPQCQSYNFTNEAGIGGTTRLLKNITGLWLLQECRRIWRRAGREYTWQQMDQMAQAAPPLVALVNPDDPRFTAPDDMPAAIQEACRQAGQRVPESDGAIARCALESLALRCRQVLGWLEELSGAALSTIHIVGGGAQNGLLCQMTADACGRRVLAGPTEATSIGNILVQAIADGELATLTEARQIVRASFPLDEYTPHATTSPSWDDAFERFVGLG